MLFPYDCVSDFLTSHPLLMHTRTRPERIHSFVYDMMKAKQERKGTLRENSQKMHADKTEAQRCFFSCRLCHGEEYEINHRESVVVCTKCGCTEQFINPENCMYHAEIGQMSQQDNGADATSLMYEVRNEILHWSEHPACQVKQTEDEQRITVARAMQVRNASVTERAVSALLFPIIQRSVDVDEIERRIRQQLPLQTMPAFQQAEKKFKCERCGESVMNRFEIRRHGCTFGAKRRRQG